MRRCFGNDKFKIEFSYAGKISSVTYCSTEKAELETSAIGFYLYNGYHKILLSEVSAVGNILTCSSANKTQSAVFEVDERSEYITFSLISTTAVVNSANYSLHFEVKGEGIRLFELDYMTEAEQEGDTTTISYPYLYNTCADDPLGKFALYYADDEDHEDDILLTIWTEQEVTHPTVNFAWTKENVVSYIKRFLSDYADRSQMMIKANDEQELYSFTPYLEKMGAKQVYLFTDTWRKDDFWPMNDTNWGLNDKIFPSGIADLRRYSNYLSERGMKLVLHYVSGGIGFFDPLYIGSKPDKRLASWGALSLVEAIVSDTENITVKPLDDTRQPYLINAHVKGIRMPGLKQFFTYNYLLVGDEIIKFDSILVNSDGNWQMTGCRRGMFDTVSARHGKDSKLIGLISPYDVNFLPSNDNEMLDEVADGYAGLINGGNIAHTEYDGAEIHNYNPWGYRKFADKVYARLDHLVTAHDSSGKAPRSYYHMRLNSVKKLISGDCPWGHINHHANIKPYAHSRKATNFFESHYNMSLGHEGSALGIALPEPMFGESLADLQGHGGCDDIIEVVKTWKDAARVMPPQVHDFISSNISKPNKVWNKYNDHPVADFVNVVSKDDNSYNLTPTYVMAREKGDIQWQFGQEHGCLSPRQFVRGGQGITLINKVATQKPDAIIQVLWGQDERGTVLSHDSIPQQSKQLYGEYDFFQDNNKGDDTHDDDTRPNIDITPTFDELSDFDDMKIAPLADKGISIKLTNSEKTEFLDAEYGASYKVSCSMKNHRGMAITVVGDGSGAVLLVKFSRRDYPIKVDFVGRKTIVIPHGEVAWYSGDWGFRMKTKCTDYGLYEDVQISIGYLPPETSTNIAIEQILVLREEVLTFSEISLQLNNSSLLLCSESGITSGDIIVFRGDKADLYDKSWFKKEVLSCNDMDFTATNGANTFALSHNAVGNLFFEVQLITKDTPIKF